MNIMTVSDSLNLSTGMARVHRHAVDALARIPGVSILPCGWFGYSQDQIKEAKTADKLPPLIYETNGQKIRYVSIPKDKSQNTMSAIAKAMGMFKPQILLTLGDPQDFWYCYALKVNLGLDFKWIAYLNIESADIYPKTATSLKYADKIIVPTLFGKKVLNDLGLTDVVVMPYGVEESFKRLPEEERVKLKIQRKCTNKIRFITVAQNTFRKNLPALLQSIQIATQQRSDLEFYLHTNVANISDEACDFDILKIANKLGILDKISYPETLSVFDPCPDTSLCNEYNASDFFILPSVFEGYGLPVHEAMACGIPAIANSSSTMFELLGSPYDFIGKAPRGWLVGHNIEIWSPDRFIRKIDTQKLALCMIEAANSISNIAGMQRECEEYGKRSWSPMETALIEVVERLDCRASILVEEV